MSAMAELSQYIGVDEAAKMLGVTSRTIKRYIERGILIGYQRALGRGPQLLLRADIEKLSEIVPTHPSDQADE